MARSRSRRSPATCPRSSAPRSAAVATGSRSRRPRPTSCSSCAARGSTSARCAARRSCRSASSRPARRSRWSRASASRASRSTSTGTRRRSPPSSPCPPARRTAARSRSTRTSSSRSSTTCAPTPSTSPPTRRTRWSACGSSTTARSRASAARARTTRPPLAVEAVLGGELKPFQRAGVAYALDARRTFLADEQGLGKTVQALAALEADDAYPAVVICPASLKLNWERETRHWLPHRTIAVVSGTGTVAPAAEITVINYDIIHAHRARLALRRPRALVLDESHYVKNPRAKRTQSVRRLAESLPPEALRLALTGTPVMNHAEELIPQLRILGRLEDFGSGARFARRFQGIGAEERIHWHLRRRCFVRRVQGRRAAAAPRQAPGRRPGRARQRPRVPAGGGGRDRVAARAAARPARARPHGRRRAPRRAARAAQRAAPARLARQGRRRPRLGRGLPRLRRAAGRLRRAPRDAGPARRALPRTRCTCSGATRSARARRRSRASRPASRSCSSARRRSRARGSR